jgi:hypothetical protein
VKQAASVAPLLVNLDRSREVWPIPGCREPFLSGAALETRVLLLLSGDKRRYSGRYRQIAAQQVQISLSEH